MKQWQLLNERFNQLQQREKLLLWASSLLLTLWLSAIYWLQPMWQMQLSSEKQLHSLQRQQSDAQQLSAGLRQQVSTDMADDYRQRIDALQQQQQQLSEQIRLSASHFIGAEQMVTLLQNVLQSSRGVQLKSLHSAPAEPVKLQGQSETDTTLLYQHKLRLTISSSYANLYQVLQRMEQLPWLVNWAALQYQVTEYPQADMTLELITVSENEDFIRL